MTTAVDGFLQSRRDALLIVTVPRGQIGSTERQYGMDDERDAARIVSCRPQLTTLWHSRISTWLGCETHTPFAACGTPGVGPKGELDKTSVVPVSSTKLGSRPCLHSDAQDDLVADAASLMTSRSRRSHARNRKFLDKGSTYTSHHPGGGWVLLLDQEEAARYRLRGTEGERGRSGRTTARAHRARRMRRRQGGNGGNNEKMDGRGGV